MRSVVIAMSGMAVRMLSTISLKDSTVYNRFISLSTPLSPDCSGMWQCSITFGLSRMTSIRSDLKSRG